MRKPAHATGNTPVMCVTVFQRNSRNRAFEATGADPSHIAQTVTAHPLIEPHEREAVRRKLRDAMKAVQDKLIPNLEILQLDIGNRRIKIKRL